MTSAHLSCPDTVSGSAQQGSATIFTRSGGTWTEQQTITQSDGATGDRFGSSVALSSDGSTAIVGAPNDDLGSASDAGTATIFTRSGGTWTEQQKMWGYLPAASDQFGFWVALSSDATTAIVGAIYDDVSGVANQGSATIFTRSGGTWTEQQTITQTDGEASDFFGYSVALSSDGNTAIVGAPQDDVARRSPWTTFNGSRCAGYFCAAPSGRSAPSTWR